MKRMRLAALLLCVAMLCACGQQPQNNTPNAADPGQEDVLPVKLLSDPVYEYEDQLVSRQFTDEESGELYATYSYRVPMMRVANADELTDEALAAAQRNTEAFNAYMQEVLDEAVAFGEDLTTDLDSSSFSAYNAMPIADEKELTASQTGQIITVRVDGYYYGGGVHPYGYTSSYTFDLTVGQFIDPIQIGDDPESFRVKAAALLVAQAESLGEDYTSGYWNDYAEIISRWNDAAVLFDASGMTVIFSSYELGPYAMGPVELFLTYDALADVIGEGGLTHLGVA